jgi:hypothetical protein
LLQIFKTLPRTVEAAYESILNRSTNAERARKLLSIILAAVRPLTLTELKIAFSIDRKGNYGKLDEKPEVDSSEAEFPVVGPIERAFRESIRQYCGLFIRITESKVYLIHQTAQEFLLESQATKSTKLNGWKHSFKSVDIHLTLARSCIWYLKLPQFAQAPGATLKIKYELIPQHPFVEYSATHWTTHFNAADTSEVDEISADATTLCLTDTGNFITWSMIWMSTTRGIWISRRIYGPFGGHML